MAINSQVGGRQHLGHIGQALQYFVDAILAQGSHARLQRAVANLGGAGALADVLADGVVALHQLVDAQAPPVAVAVALGAALALP